MTEAYARVQSKGNLGVEGNLPQESQVNTSFCTGKDTTDAAHASVEQGFYFYEKAAQKQKHL